MVDDKNLNSHLVSFTSDALVDCRLLLVFAEEINKEHPKLAMLDTKDRRISIKSVSYWAKTKIFNKAI